MSHPLSDAMGSAMEKIRTMVDVNTVVGDPITTPDGVTVIPVSKVNFGFGGGGSDFVSKQPVPASQNGNPFGFGTGAGITVTPVSFLVIKKDSVRVLPVAAPAGTSVDRIIEMLPDIVDKITEMIQKNKEKKAAEASEI